MQIQRAGQWKSDEFMAYVRANREGHELFPWNFAVAGWRVTGGPEGGERPSLGLGIGFPWEFREGARVESLGNMGGADNSESVGFSY